MRRNMRPEVSFRGKMLLSFVNSLCNMPNSFYWNERPKDISTLFRGHPNTVKLLRSLMPSIHIDNKKTIDLLSGSSTPRNNIPLGHVPRTILFRGVWYPAQYCSAGSRTPHNFVLRGTIPRGTVCEKNQKISAGYETPHKVFPRGHVPRKTLFCGVRDPAEFCSAGSRTPLTYSVPREIAWITYENLLIMIQREYFKLVHRGYKYYIMPK